MELRSVFALIVMVLAAHGFMINESWAASPFQRFELNDCAVLIKDYKKASLWKDGKTRILIEADTACAGRIGRPLELFGVQLTVKSGFKQVARLYSPTGVLSQRQKKFILGETWGPEEAGMIPLVHTLVLNFEDQTIRSPSGILLELK